MINTTTLNNLIAQVPCPPNCPPPPPGNVGPGKIYNPLAGTNLQSMTGAEFVSALIPALITLLLVVGVIVFVFIFLTGSIQWMTSGSDKAAHENAKSKLTNGLVGIVILFATFAIMIALGEFFDIDLLLINLESLRLAP
jgi:hypothetical protein